VLRAAVEGGDDSRDTETKAQFGHERCIVYTRWEEARFKEKGKIVDVEIV
jgi:hypothetical protein